jgi:lysozyme
MFQLVDVSNWQGNIDWTAVKGAGIDGGLCKATEGVGFRDATFHRNWAELKRLGMVRGAYHYANPDSPDPTSEARFFCDIVGPLLDRGDVLALDIEEGSGHLLTWCRVFLSHVTERFGFKPLVYTSPAFVQEHGLGGLGNDDYGLWVAHWGVSAPMIPEGWSTWAVWQHTARGQVAGINGNVDMNWFNGDVDQFRRYGYQPAGGVPIPDPAPNAGNSIVQDLEIAIRLTYEVATSDSTQFTGELKSKVDQAYNVLNHVRFRITGEGGRG